MKTISLEGFQELVLEEYKGSVITLVYKGSLWYVLVCTV